MNKDGDFNDGLIILFRTRSPIGLSEEETQHDKPKRKEIEYIDNYSQIESYKGIMLNRFTNE